MIGNKKKDSISDFEKQFKYHNNIDDYWGDQEILNDIVNPFDLSLIKNKIICEMGVGSGRILKNLIKLSPKKIYGPDNNWQGYLWTYQEIFGKDCYGKNFRCDFESDDGRKHWFYGFINDIQQYYNPPLATPYNSI